MNVEPVVRTGAPRHIGGVSEPTSATVQPALLARVAREQGVKAFEGSPITALQRSTPLVVKTARGRITADRVVLALNGWTGQLHELRRAMVVVSSAIVISDPVTGAGAQRLPERGEHLGVAPNGSLLPRHERRWRSVLDDEWSQCGLVRFPPRGLPPEPARFIGGTAVRAAVARKERAEARAARLASSTAVWPAWLPSGWSRWTDQRLMTAAGASRTRRAR